MENINFNEFKTETKKFSQKDFPHNINEIPLKLISYLENSSEIFCFLESAIDVNNKGQYSILAFGNNFTISNNNILSKIEEILNEISHLSHPELPMVGSLFGYIPYTAIKEFEPSVNCGNSKLIPQGLMFLPKNLLIIENKTNNIYISSIYKNKNNIEEVFSLIKNDIFVKSYQHNVKAPAIEPNTHKHENGFFSKITKEDYKSIVTKCIEYIKKGDIFQIVPSIQFFKPFINHPLTFYKKLKSINPSPYMFYFCDARNQNFAENFTIIGASPEILINCKSDEITLRPLAGTIKRGKNEEEDLQNEKTLLNDTKEIAEHLMLLDLGRNDVGKVATNVYVEKQMQIERYSHVMHISSTVKGTRKPECSMVDILKSGLPAGTLSGAPKIRAMQIISELENNTRDFYAGTMGYISKTVLQTCIMLRSVLIKNNILHTQVGAGIVYDSNPEQEYMECIHKLGAIAKSTEEN